MTVQLNIFYDNNFKPLHTGGLDRPECAEGGYHAIIIRGRSLKKLSCRIGTIGLKKPE